MVQLCILILSTWVGLPHSFICTRQAVQNRCSAYSPCTSKAARRHSNFLDLHASISTLSTSSTAVCVSGPLQLYPTLFTPVVAPVSNHSHPVCAQAVWSVHSLVAWASLCLGSTPLHGGNVPSISKSIDLYFIFLY